ncbi:hypothetical protein PsYK624_000210 [Phanerochaete sordida]|uniref:Uncharacterized protein n=1 Tax=Phanerochaete sordida TaxID=48140 RepID=A0A9P3FWN6_9APHY|nr:hypothetical protein PsYK624_000210 [Phanerochaete sordida]
MQLRVSRLYIRLGTVRACTSHPVLDVHVGFGGDSDPIIPNTPGRTLARALPFHSFDPSRHARTFARLRWVI